MTRYGNTNRIAPDRARQDEDAHHCVPSFRLIGIRAPVAGKAAVRTLLSHIPDNCQDSFVILQHGDDGKSPLTAKSLNLDISHPVVDVTDNMPVGPACIYVVPCEQVATLESKGADVSADLRFRLVPQVTHVMTDDPIDSFFRSLAETAADTSVAITLSGAGCDGDDGIRAIRHAGGLVMALDPQAAMLDGSTPNAIPAETVECVLPPEQMMARIADSSLPWPDTLAPHLQWDTALYQRLLLRIESETGIDFAAYKPGTIQRRAALRIERTHSLDLASYLRLMETDPNEAAQLAQSLLIGTTRFFRDRPLWQALRETVLADLFAAGDPGTPVKIWMPACSTGQEVYTLALIMANFRMSQGIARDFRIIASDINATAVDRARRARYTARELVDIPDTYRQRHLLVQSGDMIEFTGAIKRHIVFTQHNILADPPFVRTDLVVCRNLAMYLTASAQKRLMTTLSFSLRKDGLLMLGASESLGRDSVGLVDRVPSARIYQNSRKPRNLSLQRTKSHSTEPSANRALQVAPNHVPEHIVQTLATHTDACILVIDGHDNVLQSYGAYRDYLDLPEGGFSTKIADLLPSDIRSSVLLLLKHVQQKDTPIERSDMSMVRNAQAVSVNIHGQSAKWTADVPVTLLTIVRAPEAPQDAAHASTPDALSQSAELLRLRSENQDLRSLLSATTAELSKANAHMQATSEDLNTANEELQASVEELQSANEELQSVNAENCQRIVDLEAAQDDIENLLDSVEFAVVFLDSNLRIRRFSKGVTRFLTLDDRDVGRGLPMFTSSLTHASMVQLLGDIQDVLKTGDTRSRYVDMVEGGQGYAIVNPFFSRADPSHGVSVKLFDRTELAELRREVQRQRDQLESLIESDTAGYWDWNIPDQTLYYSPQFKKMLGYAQHEMPNLPQSWHDICHPDDLPDVLAAIDSHFQTRGAVPLEHEIRFFCKDGSIKWVLYRGHVVEWDTAGAPLRMMGVNVDVTSLKQREEEIREVRRFAFIAAHDLMQPANTIQSSLAMLDEDYGAVFDGDARQLIDFANAAAVRLRARIGAVLDYSRLGSEKLGFEVVDLFETTQACLADLTAQVVETEARVQVGDLPKALGAPTLLTQVIQNLLSNAMKYRRPDRECRIDVDQMQAPPGMVGVRITDNGIGIPYEGRSKVFDLFTRLHSEEDYAGNGVGLSLCERLVTQHGGRIWIGDGEDGGASFMFTLKAADDAT